MVMNLEANIDKWVETERQEGLEQGLKQGKQLGKKEGIKEGMEKGFYNAAKALLSTGKTVEETIKLLSLPKSVANRLREEYKTVH